MKAFFDPTAIGFDAERAALFYQQFLRATSAPTKVATAVTCAYLERVIIPAQSLEDREPLLGQHAPDVTRGSFSGMRQDFTPHFGEKRDELLTKICRTTLGAIYAPEIKQFVLTYSNEAPFDYTNVSDAFAQFLQTLMNEAEPNTPDAIVKDVKEKISIEVPIVSNEIAYRPPNKQTPPHKAVPPHKAEGLHEPKGY